MKLYLPHFIAIILVMMCVETLYAQPSNNNCSSAIPLPPNTDCTYSTGDNNGVTPSGETPAPSCGNFGAGNDVWYSITVPPEGNLQIEMNDAGGPTDWAMSAYSGSCGALAEIACNDDGGPGLFPYLSLTGLTPGSTVYIRAWEYGSDAEGAFNICAISPPPPAGNTDCATMDPFCTDSGATYPAGVDNGNTQPAGNNYSCGFDVLQTQPNAAWFYLQIATGGDLIIDLTTSPAQDIDFALWGPYPDLSTAQANCGSFPLALDCSYSTSPTEVVDILGATVGEVYVLMVTNFSNNPTSISANLNTAQSTGATDCSIVNCMPPDLIETYSGCQGDGYTYVGPNGVAYNEFNPTENTVLQDTDGCDYNFIVDLQFSTPDPDIAESYIGCLGDGYTFTSPSGIIYDENNPIGTEFLIDSKGCDYIVDVVLAFLTPDPDIFENYNGCLGDGYAFISPSGMVYDENNPTGAEFLQDANGCDYIVDVNLSFANPSPNIFETYSGCIGDGYAFVSPSGMVYDENNPTGNEILIDLNGCDYILDVNLTFAIPSADIFEFYTGCFEDEYSYTSPSGIIYDENNPTGNEILVDQNGCNYLLEVNFIFNIPEQDISEIYIGCIGDGYSFISPTGIIYDENNPMGDEVLVDQNGCEYALEVNLLFNIPQQNLFETYTGCIGDGYSYISPSGIIYDENNPTGNEVLIDPNGCNYLLDVNLLFNIPESNISETYTGCRGDGYTYISPSGIIYDEINPAGNEILIDQNGCEYALEVILIFNTPEQDILETYSGCMGDGYSYISPSGTTYGENNPVGNEVLTDANGCNYTLDVNLTFNILQPDIFETYTGCLGDGYAYTSPSGTTYDENNPIGNEILTDLSGCDYLLDVNFTFNIPEQDISEIYIGCLGDGYAYTSPSGNVYDENNPLGNEILTDANGCNYTLDVNLIFEALPIANTASLSACDEGAGQALFNLTDLENSILGAGSGTVSWFLDNMAQVPLNSPDSYNAGNGSVFATVDNGFCISLPAEIILSISELPTFTNLSNDCLPSNVDYEVIFEVTGGTPPYTISGGTGTLLGDVFTSDPFPIGNTYSFLITDSNGCGPITVEGNNLQCDCATDAGSMDPTLINTCQENLISALFLGGEVLDPNDILLFVLHDNPGNSLGTIYATNTSPDFDLNTIPNLILNTTYYISAVAGTNIGQTNIDYADPCLSVSLGTPFIIHEAPTASLGPDAAICEGECYDLTLFFSGTAPFTATYTINHPITGDESNTITTSDNFYNLNICSNGLTNETITVTLESVVDNFCPGNITSPETNISINPILTSEALYDGCIGDGYSLLINGNTYNESNPTGTETLLSAFGCDSIVIINLAFTNSVSGNETHDGCLGDGYSVIVNGNTYDQNNPTGTENLVSGSGCDSIVTISLSYNEVLSGEALYNGCLGDGYSILINGNLYDETNPIGTETLQSTNGCDSIVSINLSFNESLSSEIVYDGCFGDGYTTSVNGNIYNETNPTGTETLQSSNGCDSIVNINLNFSNSVFGNEVYNGCFGDGYAIIVNGNAYNETNSIGTETLISAGGCDSIVNINLNFSTSINTSELYEGCQDDGYTVIVNGNTYDQNSPFGTETLTSNSGCDSVVTINLVFNDILSGEIVYDGCFGDGYTTSVNGNIYNETNPTGTETLQSSNGCDSIVNINLNFSNSVFGNEVYNGCFGDGYAIIVNGNAYNETNSIGTETLISAGGCDSIVNINLNFSTSINTSELYEGCQDDGYTVIVNGNTYDQNSPFGTETLTSNSGCDSVVTINLVFNDILSGEIVYDGCFGDGYTTSVNGNIYNETNPTGTETLQSSNGCDSIVNINLNFSNSVFGNEVYNGCFGDGYAIIVNGNAYNETNSIGTETLISAGGCDSIVNINLNFSTSINTSELYEGCQDDGYTVIVNGNTYDQNSPFGTETLTSNSGCDSVVTINLVFNDILSGEIVYDGCFGDGYTTSVNGNIYNETNPTGTETLQSSNGCDSIVNINLNFSNSVFGNEVYNGCFGDGYALTINGNTYNETNPNGQETLTSANGCDSIVSINFNFNSALAANELYEGCQGDGYTVVVNGNTYDQNSPFGTETLTSSFGCDSVVTINLTYNEILNGTSLYTGCLGDEYSISINGNIYDETNPFGTETLQSSNGCDSIVNIDLTFYNSVTETEVYQGCLGDGYTLLVNGVTYNEDNPLGTEIISGGNHLGCDSIIQVALSFSNATEATITETLCETETILVNGNAYGLNNPNGTEIIPGGSFNGCDSIINVALDFHPQVLASISQNASICPGDSIPISFTLEGGTTYDLIFNNGISNTTLSGISNGETIMVSPENTTTYSISNINAIGIPCTPVLQNSFVTITVSEIALSAQIDSDYSGFSVACHESSNGIATASPLNGTAPFYFEWSNGSTTTTVQDLSAGVYTVTATDDIGCSAEASVTLTEPALIQPNLNSVSPDCFGDHNGSIIIDTIIGGSGTYTISIDGQNNQSISTFPTDIPFLATGNYEVLIEDSYNCSNTSTIFIPEPQEPTLLLGDDIQITLGDSIALNPITNILVDYFAWNDTRFMSCDTCLYTYTSPTETTLYTLEVTDSLGCSATDDLRISVYKPRDVYIPSAFSPNGDGVNDFFFVNGGQEVLKLNTMRVYNRWGEEVYFKNNFEVNNPDLGWDGRFRGQEMDPAVFVYLVEIEFIDGVVELFKGDVTLFK